MQHHSISKTRMVPIAHCARSFPRACTFASEKLRQERKTERERCQDVSCSEWKGPRNTCPTVWIRSYGSHHRCSMCQITTRTLTETPRHPPLPEDRLLHHVSSLTLAVHCRPHARAGPLTAYAPNPKGGRTWHTQHTEEHELYISMQP